MDEWNLVEKKIPSFDLVFEVDHAHVDATDVELTDEQRTVIELVDGQRDVHAIIEESGLVEFEVGKAIYGLLTAGFVRRVGRSKATTAPEVSETRVEEHRNLGVAFYKTGMLDEAMREFKRVLELRGSDAIACFYTGLALARQGKLGEATASLKEAASQPGVRYAILHNLAYVLERQGRYAEAQAALQEAARRGGATDARVQTSLGVVALLAGDVATADGALAAARPLFGNRPPTAAWFHYAALTAALLGDHQRAADILTAGIAAHPRSAALYNNLAVVRERQGRFDEALATLEKGIQEDAAVPQLQKNMGDLLYRVGRYDEAFEAYSRAVKANPDIGGDIYLKLGNIRFRRQERDEAVRCWERALELDPENAIVRTNLESVRQVLG
jgi:tetratricopeptide (TPR) repeat protein